MRDRMCWCRVGQQRYPVRVLALALPSEIAATKRRRKLKEARTKGRHLSEQKLFYLGFIVLVTTLDAQWTAEAIMQLYRARWQIELIFKRMKQVLRAQVIRSTTPAQAEATVRLLLIAWALPEQDGQRIRATLRTVHQHLHHPPLQANQVGQALREPHISSWVLTKVCVATLRSQVAGTWSCEQLWERLPRLLRFLCPSPRRRLHQETVIRIWLRQQEAMIEPMVSRPVGWETGNLP